MSNHKLEDCQTYRYHKNCGIHERELISMDEQSLVDIPMLSVVEVLHRYILSDNSKRAFPTSRSIIRCNSTMIVHSKIIGEEDIDRIHKHYGIICGTAINITARAKDKQGFTTNFQNLTREYEMRLAHVQSMDEVKSVLGILKSHLEDME